jgi:hypothetical protein
MQQRGSLDAIVYMEKVRAKRFIKSQGNTMLTPKKQS